LVQYFAEKKLRVFQKTTNEYSNPMWSKNKLTEQLKIVYSIIQAPMVTLPLSCEKMDLNKIRERERLRARS
jgi:hypothetical protein